MSNVVSLTKQVVVTIKTLHPIEGRWKVTCEGDYWQGETENGAYYFAPSFEGLLELAAERNDKTSVY